MLTPTRDRWIGGGLRLVTLVGMFFIPDMSPSTDRVLSFSKPIMSDQPILTETQSRLVGMLGFVGGLAILFDASLPAPAKLLTIGLLGAGVVFLMAPAWVTGRWKALWHWLRPW